MEVGLGFRWYCTFCLSASFLLSAFNFSPVPAPARSPASLKNFVSHHSPLFLIAAIPRTATGARLTQRRSGGVGRIQVAGSFGSFVMNVACSVLFSFVPVRSAATAAAD